MITNLKYYNNCTCWEPNDVSAEGGLCGMIEGSLQIHRGTFEKHVDLRNLASIEASIGYDDDFKMEDDAYVSYHRSKHHGKTVYYFRWSAIEYVFA